MSTTRERYLQWKNRLLLPQLPIEIWAHIFAYLEINDLLSIRLVSRLFYSCVNQHTDFWRCIIFDIDQCPNYLIQSNLLHNVRSSNMDLFTKSNLYSHCMIYLKSQPLVNSINKRRKRRLLLSRHNDDELKKKPYLRCSSVHFESLRSFDQLQLEHLLTKRVKRLELSYECSSTGSSLNFLLKIEQLKYLKILFIHNITEVDAFAMMLINTMQGIVNLLFKIKRLKSLTLNNLYLTQPFAEDVYFIERLRSIWLEDCINVHFFLSVIDKQWLKNVILRRATCDRVFLTIFVNQLDTVRYLDLSSLQIIKPSISSNEQFHLPSRIKTCSLNNTFLQFCSFRIDKSIRSLELTDINNELLAIVLKTFQSLKILCLFFTNKSLSLSSMINYLQQSKYSHLWIHFHLLSVDDHDEKQVLPSNILIMPIKKVLSCFCYQNLI